jgi:hypothetical protein
LRNTALKATHDMSEKWNCIGHTVFNYICQSANAPRLKEIFDDIQLQAVRPWLLKLSKQ